MGTSIEKRTGTGMETGTETETGIVTATGTSASATESMMRGTETGTGGETKTTGGDATPQQGGLRRAAGPPAPLPGTLQHEEMMYGPERVEQIASANPALQQQRRPASSRTMHGTEALPSLRASVALLVDTQPQTLISPLKACV